jgi:membrane-associated phospholipid phosphatase
MGRGNHNLFLFFVIYFLCFRLYGQTDEPEYEPEYEPEPYTESVSSTSIKMVFHNIGWNVLNSITYNYGANFLFAGLGTYGMIETGIDMQWRNVAYNNLTLAKAGIPAVYIGFPVAGLAPVAFYLVGYKKQNTKIQILGLALAQSLFITLSIQTAFKLTTGRAEPGIIDFVWHKRGQPDVDNSRKFDWFSTEFMMGWPSGHTATAFSAAATIAEIYKDNLWVKIGAYSYAALMGLSVSVNVHWASDVIAGCFIGYAIGKTVGKSFNKLLGENDDNNKVSLLASPNMIGVNIRI